MARKAMASGRYHLVVLDEFTYLLTYGIIELDTVLGALKGQPEGLHLVITGRNAPRKLIGLVDPVTEMRAIKHPHKIGTKAQKGVAF